MKPLELRVRGLHSFRKEQHVDFENLCSGGVFGIFGPTGSGKSSILDAMTFALYGKITRFGSSQGSMINQAEKEVSVNFTFKLGTRIFEAERRAKRTDDTKMRTTRSRFLERTTEPVVLADKSGEMNEKIEDLLGLKLDDFTRAVVLPQNKFSEFLSLRGTDRAAMLERLFDLKKYGDELSQKIKERHYVLQARIENIESEQMGLGDASFQALQQAKERCLDIDKTLNEKSSESIQHEERWQNAKAARQLQKESEALVARAEKLRQERPLHEKQKKVLRLSEAVEGLLPFKTAVDKANMAFEKAEKEWLESDTDLKKIRKQEAEAKKIFSENKNQRREKEPSLTTFLSQLKEAEKTEKQVRKWTEQQKSYESDIRILQKEDKTCQQYSKEIQEIKDKQEEILRLQQEKITDLTEKQETRNRMRNAYEQARMLEEDAKRLGEEKSALRTAEESYTEHLRSVDKTEEKMKVCQQTLQENVDKIYQYYVQSGTLKRTREIILSHLESVTKADAAAHVATHLRGGEACPVCGSIHHPSPATQKEKQADQKAQQLLEQMRMDTRLNMNEWRLEQLSSQTMSAINLAVEPSAASESELENEPPLPQLDRQPRELLGEAERWFLKMNALVDAVDRLERTVQNNIQEWQKQKSATNEAKALAKQAKNMKKQTKQRHQEREKEYKQKEKDWQETYPNWSLASIEQRWQHAQKENETLEEIRKEVNERQINAGALQQKLADNENEKREINLALARKNADYEHITKQIQEQRGQLNTLIGFETAAAVIERTSASLQSLQLNEEDAEQTFEKTTKTRQECDTRHAAAKRRFETIQEQLEDAKANWQKQQNNEAYQMVQESLVHAQRITPESLQVLRLSENEYDDYIEQVKQYEEEWAKTYHRLTELENSLSGKRISDEQWQAIDHQQKRLVKELQKLQESRGSAEAKWFDIKQKHERFETLEKERISLTETSGHYRELEKVFRGKAFVDFIAEEQLLQVTRSASERLYALSRGRFALALDSDRNFLVADYLNGGQKRSTSTLSGGETFLTSLALALSLSASIQLKGQYALQFFFLDEGFGTLDAELLDTVITALEQLQTEHLAVGVISHVPELRERLHRRLLVTPPQPNGDGSRLRIEH